MRAERGSALRQARPYALREAQGRLWAWAPIPAPTQSGQAPAGIHRGRDGDRRNHPPAILMAAGGRAAQSNCVFTPTGSRYTEAKNKLRTVWCRRSRGHRSSGSATCLLRRRETHTGEIDLFATARADEVNLGTPCRPAVKDRVPWFDTSHRPCESVTAMRTCHVARLQASHQSFLHFEG